MEDTADLGVRWPESGICILKMNRPKSYNALTKELVGAMRAAVATLWDTGGRVMILTGSAPGFCAGADLKQRRTMSDSEKYAHNRAINSLVNEVAALPIPTIAAINGTALGGGCELSLACDVRVASTEALIGLTEARIGAMPGAGGSQRLPRLIGTARALEMMFSGEPVTARRAAEIGLVNEACAPEKLEERVMTLARLFAARSRRTTSLLKKAVYEGLERPLPEALELERQAVAEVLASDDYSEGLAAFAERREPKFS